MAHAPLVSIILPTRDRPDYLAQSLRSALAQSHEALEIIVCDDASANDVDGLIKRIGDDRVRVIRSDVPTQKVGIFREGLRAARGEYVMELDDDDLLAPNCVELLLSPLMWDRTAVASFSDFWIMDSRGFVDAGASDTTTRVWTRDRLAPGRHEPFIDLALGRQAMWTSICGLFRRSRLDLGDLPLYVGGHADYWLAYLACRDGGAAWYNPMRLGFYREHGGNLTRSVTQPRLADRRRMYERMLGDDRVADVAPGDSSVGCSRR